MYQVKEADNWRLVIILIRLPHQVIIFPKSLPRTNLSSLLASSHGPVRFRVSIGIRIVKLTSRTKIMWTNVQLEDVCAHENRIPHCGMVTQSIVHYRFRWRNLFRAREWVYLFVHLNRAYLVRLLVTRSFVWQLYHACRYSFPPINRNRPSKELPLHFMDNEAPS